MTDDEKAVFLKKCENNYEMLLCVETVGFDNTIKLLEVFQGERIVFPKRLYMKIRNFAIQQEFKNLIITRQPIIAERHLAGKYGISTRQIRHIIQSINS